MKSAILKSWRSSLVALAAIVKAGLMASQSQDLMATVHDPHFQMFVVIGILGLVAKDGAQ